MLRLQQTLGWTLVALTLGLASCQSPLPGYRNEGLGPDERLIVLADAFADRKDAGGGDMNDGALVDGGRLQNELRRLSLEYPTHAPTLYMLATVEFEEGSHERAAGYLDDLFAVQRAHPEAGLLRARLSIADGNLRGARRVLEQQILYTPDHPGLREGLGSVAFLAGDLDDAREQLEMARRLGAPIWRVCFNLGLIEEAAGKPAPAVLLYDLAIEARPDFEQAHSRRAGLMAEFGDVIR